MPTQRGELRGFGTPARILDMAASRRLRAVGFSTPSYNSYYLGAGLDRPIGRNSLSFFWLHRVYREYQPGRLWNLSCALLAAPLRNIKLPLDISGIPGRSLYVRSFTAVWNLTTRTASSGN